ncbi:unnamed protein product [Meganyctiphanes norvegica]|uniref:Thioredoxin domain-containing protein n=1 Tax=Meganyctiphanes norvegica TaxID=48144 RepID=A0AAV2QXW4_MEGNR
MPAVDANGSGDEASTAPQHNPATTSAATTKTAPLSSNPTEEPPPQPPDILKPLLKTLPAKVPVSKGSIIQQATFEDFSSSKGQILEETHISTISEKEIRPPKSIIDQEITSQDTLVTNAPPLSSKEKNTCNKQGSESNKVHPVKSSSIEKQINSHNHDSKKIVTVYVKDYPKDSQSKESALTKKEFLDTSEPDPIKSGSTKEEEQVEISESHNFRSTILLHEDSSPEDSPPEDSPKKVKKSKSKKTIYRSMLLILKISIATAIATFLSALCSGSLQSETKTPSPFFPPYSLVSDFYTGQVSELVDRLLSSDISLVVYYAPWDRDCQELRWELEKVARFHHEQVFIAAINCWQPGSQCRQTYKIRPYPAIVAHIRAPSGLETKAVAYEGPRKAAHIINFLSRALKPFSHVTSAADLAKLQTQYDSTVLGYYDFSSGSIPPGFRSFHLAALRTMGNPKGSSIGWGVVTNLKAAKSLSFNQTRSIHYVLWNTTLLYTGAASANSESISNWVLRRYDKTCRWLDFPATKTLDLNNILTKGPTLMLFMPDNPYYETNDPYSVLREVSLEYHNCEEKSRLQRMASIISSARTHGRNQLRQAQKKCHEYIKDKLKTMEILKQQQNDQCFKSLSASDPNFSDDFVVRKCSNTGSNKWTSEVSHSCSLPSYSSARDSLIQHAQSLLSVFSDSCREMILQYTPWEDQNNVCCYRNSTVNKNTNQELTEVKKMESSNEIYNQHIIDDHIEKMLTASALDQCKRLFHGSMIAPHALLKELTPDESITGLGCKTNKTLSFVAVDSLRHNDVAQRMGLNLTAKHPHKTGAVIVDTKNDVHFILDVSVNKQTLVNFILNYTSGELDRARVSRSDGAHSSCPDGQVCLVELNSDNYFNVTHQKGQIVMVLHYTRVCGACTTIGHALLTLAHHVKHIPSVTIARVDVSRNTLPWQFNFDSLPTIVIYPQHNKGNSHMFDSDHEVTLSNLMSFLVANLPFPQRLTLALNSCGPACARKAMHLSRQRTSHLHRRLTSATIQLQQMVTDLSIHSGNKQQLLLDNKSQLDKLILSLRNNLRHLARIQQHLRHSIENRGRDKLYQGAYETTLKEDILNLLDPTKKL